MVLHPVHRWSLRTATPNPTLHYLTCHSTAATRTTAKGYATSAPPRVLVRDVGASPASLTTSASAVGFWKKTAPSEEGRIQLHAINLYLLRSFKTVTWMAQDKYVKELKNCDTAKLRLSCGSTISDAQSLIQLRYLKCSNIAIKSPSPSDG